MAQAPFARYVPPVVVDDALIAGIARKIVEHFNPHKIILFGSYARGTANEHSDVDLLVIMDSEERPVERAANIRDVARPRFVSMDVIVRTPDEIRQVQEGFSPFFREIFREGKVLYDAARG